MQRTPQNTMPPGSRQVNPQQNGQHPASPAYTMAARIRNEQGKERAADYLAAMEPFLAPGEREHIAQSLGLPPQRPQPQQQAYQQSAAYQQPTYGQRPYQQQQQPQYAPPPYQQTFQQPQGNDPMQLLQMLSGLGGLGGKNGGNPIGNAAGNAFSNAFGSAFGGGNPMMLAQLLGGLMGKK